MDRAIRNPTECLQKTYLVFGDGIGKCAAHIRPDRRWDGEMTELYLIAHKVRGEPAFDVATQEEVEGETHWIIPTSGHRAYPWWFARLEIDNSGSVLLAENVPWCEKMPIDWPDHYATRAAPKPSPTNLLAELGLAQPKVHHAVKGEFKRRI